MNIHSVKTRLVGSYVFLILLFFIQIPIIYVLIGGMSKKYTQIVEVATLRKRAIEINYILNRHIMNGEEALEAVFRSQKKDFDTALTSLRTGTAEFDAITNQEVLVKFNNVDTHWKSMSVALDEAMDSGDHLSEVMLGIESTTPLMVDRLNNIVKGFVALNKTQATGKSILGFSNDQGYSKSIDLAGLQRMRTVKMAYLMERYARSNYELDVVAQDLKTTIADFDKTFAGLRDGSAELGLKSVKNQALLAAFKEAEALWASRKESIAVGMKDKDIFQAKVGELSNIHTPQMVAAAETLTIEIAIQAGKAAMKGVLIMVLSILITAGFAICFMYFTNSQLIRPLLRVKDTVESFAKGDLTKRANIRVTFLGSELKDEVSELAKSVDDMAGQMSGIIGRIADSSGQLASASEQLSASATQISAGADKQSGQTVQVAAAMEEMNATVIEVAKNSQQVSESARNAQNIAIKGGDVVTQAIKAMKEVAQSTSVTADTIKKLGTSSEEIGTIVSVINDIADQTNLLALNAAIEAARAGEQGRGFAVVADEVRKLAERTTKATKEISGMIGTIQTETGKAVNAMAEGTTKVENGVKLANEAGDALMRIVSGVENVTDMISHIATSAEEQSSTTDEITQNMDSIADVAKANVASISEVSRATSEMARLAAELKDLVTRFRVSDRGEVVMESKKTAPRHQPSPVLRIKRDASSKG
ncbi:MAG: type IV pili methyl-accepting chemotaxis transducer N-terminal domain-containing protein [Deltaproteobacteria bacterium]|nr:type IV pili methyl-accepting chemotaxis transducer N-terminal domain-containing protein [Deltaproteobacteria bacterium]